LVKETEQTDIYVMVKHGESNLWLARASNI